jgi:peptidoglycan/xylan/chitin deacetylase (PgdA/CDA1 family)
MAPCQIGGSGASPDERPACFPSRPIAHPHRRPDGREATTLVEVRDQLILCYHAVSDHWPSPLAVTTQALERQLGSLVKRGYRGATFEAAVTARHEGRTLAVTFDDAYHSTLTHAAPILASLGLPGTVFAPTDFIDRSEPMSWPGIDGWEETPYTDELRCLTWDGLAELREAGWEVGSHTRSHAHLTALGDGPLQEELTESRAVLVDRLGRCASLALPYGDGNGRVLRAARQAGYRAIAGLPPPGRGGPPASERVGIYRGDGPRRFRLKVATATRRIRASPLGRPLTAAARRRTP